MTDEIVSDPAFTAYCPECETTTVMENIAAVVKCHSCAHIVLGAEVTERPDTDSERGGR